MSKADKKQKKSFHAMGAVVNDGTLPITPNGAVWKLKSSKIQNLAKLGVGGTYWGRLVGVEVGKKFKQPLLRVAKEDNANQTELIGAPASVRTALELSEGKDGWQTPFVGKLVSFRFDGKVPGGKGKREYNNITVHIGEED